MVCKFTYHFYFTPYILRFTAENFRFADYVLPGRLFSVLFAPVTTRT